MKNMDLEKINQELIKFAQDRDWDQFHSVKNLSMALTVEASELAEIFQWMKEEESNLIKNNPEVLKKLEDEVADVFLYLMRIVGKAGIDLEKVALNKIQKNSQKYPVEQVKGNAKKYNEY